MLTFDADGPARAGGRRGRARVRYLPGAVNPEGSVSIIDLSRGVASARVRTADFPCFWKAALVARGVRVFAPGATAAQDLEPEYITINGRTAWVTLQEANAVAVVDVPSAMVQRSSRSVSRITRSRSRARRERPRHVAIFLHSTLRAGRCSGCTSRTRSRVSASAGSSSWSRRTKATRARATTSRASTRRSGWVPALTRWIRGVPERGGAQDEFDTGAAEVANASGDPDGDGDFDRPGLRGRSFSIWTSQGSRSRTAARFRAFPCGPANATRRSSTRTTTGTPRSTEATTRAPSPRCRGRHGRRARYAFIGLERLGGIIAYDVTNPRHRPSRPTPTLAALDGAEEVTSVPRASSSSRRKTARTASRWVLVGNEVSRTVSVFEVEKARP